MAKKPEPKPAPNLGRRALAEEIVAMILNPKGDPGNVVSGIYERLLAELHPPAVNAAVEGDEA